MCRLVRSGVVCPSLRAVTNLSNIVTGLTSAQPARPTGRLFGIDATGARADFLVLPVKTGASSDLLSRLAAGRCFFCPSLPAPRADGRLSTESLVSSQPHGPLPQGASDFACFCFCGTRHGAGGCRPCGPGLYLSSELWPSRCFVAAF